MTVDGRRGIARFLTDVRRGSYNSAARGAGWVMLGQVGAMSAALAGVRLLTAGLTPAAYGELALWLTVAALAQGLVQSPVAQAQLRMFSVARETNGMAPYWAAARRLALLSAGITVLICVAAYLLGPLFGARRNLAAAAATCLFAVTAGEFGRRTSVSIAAQRRPLAAAAQAGHEWMRVLLAVAAIHLIVAAPAVALLAFAVSASFWTLVQSRVLHRAEPGLRASASAPEIAIWRGKLLVYAWPFAAWGVAAVLQANIDRWVAGA
ncbi:MAG TPA: oligosaccharide flippase family protein, partial [Gemmatimonadaceae bacterium]|nr:oligosaccharide flippase family protein [Gemmatimonadaceae bacterium]